MLGRVLTALTVAAAITSAASAQDVKWPEVEFGRYHALVIGNNDYQHLRDLNKAVGVASVTARAAGDRDNIFQTAPRKQRQDLARSEKKKKKKAEKGAEGSGGDPDFTLTLPPRTINDVLSVLEQNRGETKAMKKARELADQPAPAGNNPTKLAKFYLIRGEAAGALGRARQQLDDLRLAARYAKNSVSGDRVKFLYRLAVAEFFAARYPKPSRAWRRRSA